MSLTKARTRIARAADAHGRDVADISLIAVSNFSRLIASRRCLDTDIASLARTGCRKPGKVAGLP